MVVRVTGLLFIVAGLLVLTVFEGVTVRAVGLGLWWFGALVALDVSLRLDGVRAQLLWGFGVGAAVYVLLYTRVPHALSGGGARRILLIPTVALAVAMFARPARRSPLLEVLDEMRVKAARAALPERPADPVAEVARVQGFMRSLIAELNASNPRVAAELSVLLSQYRSDHGDDTIETSARPTALRNAVAVLVDDMVGVRDRLVASAPGYPQAVLVVAYARQLSDLVLDHTR
jgi:hypothetical protein